jgi:hypothetical protein
LIFISSRIISPQATTHDSSFFLNWAAIEVESIEPPSIVPGGPRGLPCALHLDSEDKAFIHANSTRGGLQHNSQNKLKNKKRQTAKIQTLKRKKRPMKLHRKMKYKKKNNHKRSL